jgi:hypothetical protein
MSSYNLNPDEIRDLQPPDAGEVLLRDGRNLASVPNLIGAQSPADRLGSKAETARELAYRLYTLCERKKRAAEALDYNSLVRSWPESSVWRGSPICRGGEAGRVVPEAGSIP